MANNKDSKIFASIYNTLRTHPAWRSLTPVQKLSYIEILARYMELGRPKGFFKCPYSCIKDTSICKDSWVKALKALKSKGFIRIAPHETGYTLQLALSYSYLGCHVSD